MLTLELWQVRFLLYRDGREGGTYAGKSPYPRYDNLFDRIQGISFNFRNHIIDTINPVAFLHIRNLTDLPEHLLFHLTYHETASITLRRQAWQILRFGL